MNTKKYTIWITIALTFLLLSACSPTSSVSSKDPNSTNSIRKSKVTNRPKKRKSTTSTSSTSEATDTVTSSSATSTVEKMVEGLPENAAAAPKDKIYATGHAKVYYVKFDEGFESQTPDFTGYTPDLVKTILGVPEKVHTDSQYLQTSFKDKELENIKQLFQQQKLTEEQAHAFYLGAYDLIQASQLGETYTLYSYQNDSVFAIFEDDQLLYITPDPSVLSFK